MTRICNAALAAPAPRLSEAKPARSIRQAVARLRKTSTISPSRATRSPAARAGLPMNTKPLAWRHSAASSDGISIARNTM